MFVVTEPVSRKGSDRYERNKNSAHTECSRCFFFALIIDILQSVYKQRQYREHYREHESVRPSSAVLKIENPGRHEGKNDQWESVFNISI